MKKFDSSYLSNKKNASDDHDFEISKMKFDKFTKKKQKRIKNLLPKVVRTAYDLDLEDERDDEHMKKLNDLVNASRSMKLSHVEEKHDDIYKRPSKPIKVSEDLFADQSDDDEPIIIVKKENVSKARIDLNRNDYLPRFSDRIEKEYRMPPKSDIPRTNNEINGILDAKKRSQQDKQSRYLEEHDRKQQENKLKIDKLRSLKYNFEEKSYIPENFEVEESVDVAKERRVRRKDYLTEQEITKIASRNMHELRRKSKKNKQNIAPVVSGFSLDVDEITKRRILKKERRDLRRKFPVVEAGSSDDYPIITDCTEDFDMKYGLDGEFIPYICSSDEELEIICEPVSAPPKVSKLVFKTREIMDDCCFDDDGLFDVVLTDDPKSGFWDSYRDKFPELVKMVRGFLLVFKSEAATAIYHLVDGYLTLITNCVATVYLLLKSNNFTEASSILWLFTNSVMPDGLLVNKMFSFGFNVLVERLLRLCLRSNVKKQPIAQSLGDDLQQLSDGVNQVLSSDLSKTIRDFCLTITACQVFPKEIAGNIYKVLGKSERKSLLEVIQDVVKYLAQLTKYSELASKGVPIMSLFASNPLETTVKKADYLIASRDRVYMGLPTPGYINIYDYMRETTETICFLEKATSGMNALSRDHQPVFNKLYQLRACHMEKQSFVDSTERTTPFCFLLAGDPGIGKSNIMRFVFALLSNVMGRKFHHDHIYPRCVTSEYWEGYLPYSMPYIHYSELGGLARSIAAKMGDPTVMELTSLADNLRFCVNTAFNTKGTVFARPEAIGIDTNNETLNLDVIVENMAAYMRRLLTIKMYVKPQYRQDNSCQIDYSKTNDGTDNLNRWTFDVYATRAKDKKNGEKVWFMRHTNKDDDIYKLTKVITKLYEKHVQTELAVKEKVDNDLDNMHKYYRNTVSVLPVPLMAQSGEEDCTVYTCKCTTDNCLYNKPSVVNAIVPPSSPLPVMPLKTQVVSGVETLGNVCSDYFNSVCWSIVTSATRQWVCKTQENPEWTKFTYLRIFSSVALLFCIFTRRISWAWLPWACLCFLNFGYVIERHFADKVDIVSNNMRNKRASSWRALKMFCGMSKYDIKDCTKHAWSYVVPIVGTLVIALSIGGIVYTRKKDKKKDKKPQAEVSTFHVPDDTNRELIELEKSFHCGKSYERIPIHNHSTWNLRHSSTVPLHTSGVEDFLARMSSNIRKCQVITEKGSLKSYVFGLEGNIALINSHVFQGQTDNIRINISCTGINKEGAMKETVLQVNDYIHIASDLTLVSLNVTSFKNMLKHVIVPDVPDEMTTGYIGGCVVPVTYQTQNQSVHAKDGTVLFSLSSYYKYKWVGHAPGQCGLPLVVAKGQGFVIAGIHCAGMNADEAFSYPLDRNQLRQGIDKLILQRPFMPLSSQSLELPFLLGEPSPKSPFRYEELFTLDYYGKAPGKVLANGKSKLEKTRISKDDVMDEIWDEYDFIPTVRYGKPTMSPVMRNGKYISPWNIGLKKMASKKVALNRNVLAVVQNRIVDYLWFKLSGKFDKLSPLDLESAINGAKDDPFIKRVNASTSAGFGFDGTKSKHIPIVVDEPGNLVREPVSSLKKRIVEQLKVYSSGETNRYVTSAQLKDEAREWQKCEDGKTRLFYMSSLDSLIIQRMFLSPFYSLMVEHGDIFQSCMGTDMHRDADKLFKRLTGFASNMMEGDYSNYDQAMPFEIGWVACSIVYVFLMKAGYNHKALEIVRGLLSESLQPHIEILGDILVALALQISGKYATAEDNSLRNLVMVMYAWYSNPKLSHLDFFEYVTLALYGDDLLGSVKDEVKDFFNNVTYREVVQKVFGMDFTPASKNGELLPFVSPDKMSFLKRTFRYHEELNCYVAPLDMNSIYKTLQYYIPSQTVSEEMQMVSTYSSSLRELFFHSTREQFMNVRTKLLQHFCLTYRRQSGDVRIFFPTFDEIIENLKAPLNAVGVNIQRALDDLEFKTGSLSGLIAESGESLCNFGSINIELRNNPSCAINRAYVVTRLAIDHSSYILSLEKERQVLLNYLSTLHDPMPGFRASQVSTSLRYNSDYSFYLSAREYVNTALQVENIEYTIEYLKRRTDDHLIGVAYAESGIDGQNTSGPPSSIAEEKHQTMLDVSGDVPERNDEYKYGDDSLVSSSIVGLDKFFERPVLVGTQVIPLNYYQFYYGSTWNTFTIDKAIRAKLRYFAYMRAKLHVKLVPAATNFHYGRLFAVWIPMSSYNDVAAYYSSVVSSSDFVTFLKYLSQFPGFVTSDVTSNRPLEVEIPFISPKPFLDMYNPSNAAIGATTPFNDAVEMGQLWHGVYSPIQCIGSSPTNLSINQYIYASDVVLGCPTATNLVIAEAGDEREVGPIEKFASNSARVSEALEHIPTIGPLAKASSMLLRGLEGLSSIFGWSVPRQIGGPSFMKNQPFYNAANTVSYSTAMAITSDPKQELTADLRELAVERDELTINAFASQHSLVAVFPWQYSSTVSFTPIQSFLITPRMGRVSSVTPGFYQPSSMSFANRLFDYWHGDIVLDFDFVASRFHSGKIAFVYEPNVCHLTLAESNFTNNKQYIYELDLQQSQTVRICINWASDRPWLATLPDSMVDGTIGNTSLVDPSVWKPYCNGALYVVPLTVLESPDSSGIQVMVHASCDNLRVNSPNNNYPTAMFNISGEDSKAYAESGSDDCECESTELLFGDITVVISPHHTYWADCTCKCEICDPDCDTPYWIDEWGNICPYAESGSDDNLPNPVECIDINPYSADTASLSLHFFGEEIVSFRQLLKRFEQTDSGNFSITGTFNAVSLTDVIYPAPNPNINNSAPHSSSRTSLFNYLRYAFLGMRGSMRKRHRCLGIPTDDQCQARAYLNGPGPYNYHYELRSDPVGVPSVGNLGQVMFVPHTNGGIEFELPFFNNNLFVCSGADLPQPVDNMFTTLNYRQQYTVQHDFTPDPDDRAINITWNTDSAVGEDFQFIRRFGVPPYYIIPGP